MSTEFGSKVTPPEPIREVPDRTERSTREASSKVVISWRVVSCVNLEHALSGTRSNVPIGWPRPRQIEQDVDRCNGSEIDTAVPVCELRSAHKVHVAEVGLEQNSPCSIPSTPSTTVETRAPFASTFSMQQRITRQPVELSASTRHRLPAPPLVSN